MFSFFLKSASHFLGLPYTFWIYSGIAFAIGLFLVLYLTHRWPHTSLKHHISRDLGIACLVAVLVSVIYEGSTRSIVEHETLLESINRTMSTFVPENVWKEVNDEVLRRNVLRRNVEVKIKLFREGVLPNGQKVSLPQGQAVLWMQYGYDLYGLTAGSSQVRVQHELGYEMFNKELNLPRFERVEIISPIPNESRVFEGAVLNEIDDKKGSIILEGKYIVKLPPPREKKPVRVITERYEIVSTPGSYSLVMPELVAGESQTTEPTIRLSIEDIPNDIESAVSTYYAAHSFRQPELGKNLWTYHSIMLPGQGFTITFKLRSGAPANKSFEPTAK